MARIYAGTFAGVWRSDDAGITWRQLTRPQPPQGANEVSGALLVPNVYDLAVSPVDRDLVLAATAGDTRNQPKNGVYRSSDGGTTWSLVHQFTCSGGRPVGQVVFAPDNANLIFAAGGCAIGISSDGGVTWPVERPINGSAWHVAAGPQEGSIRRVYAAGDNQIWQSQDGGNTWFRDAANSLGSLSFAAYPDDAHGNSAHALAVEPGHPDHVYLAVSGRSNGPSYYHPKDSNGSPADGAPCNTDPRRGCGEGSLWLGDYSGFVASNPSRRAAVWTQQPGPPVYYGVSDESGNRYVETKQTAQGYLLLFSDGNHVHVSAGRPTSNGWHRLGGRDASQSKLDNQLFDKPFVHVDPHALAVSADFSITLRAAVGVSDPYNKNKIFDRYLGGTIWVANDGGVYRSNDGGQFWDLGTGLSTLGPVNVAGTAITGRAPALYMGTGDNDNFFTLNGGTTWGDPVSSCGDCDPWFADPATPSRVISFEARAVPLPGVGVYVARSGDLPDAANESQHRVIPAPSRCSGGGAPPCPAGQTLINESNAVTCFSLKGYNPIVSTVAAEKPLDDGDFVLIRTKPDGTRVLLRTTSISTFSSPADWADPSKAIQVGPNLPSGLNMTVVQVAGGHTNPVFYVADIPVPGCNVTGRMTLWKWTSGLSGWRQIVPSPSGTPPERSARKALRFFVSQYNPSLIYIVDENAIKRSDDGGATWNTDTSLDAAATEGGDFAYGGGSSVLQDMVFDRREPYTRFAVSNAGVFYTLDGQKWDRLFSTRALPSHPISAYFDPISDMCYRSLYVANAGRGLLQFGRIPYPLSTRNVSAIVAQRIVGPPTSWQTRLTPAENVEYLAAANANDDLLVFSWSPGRDWRIIDATQNVPGRDTISGPLTAWQTSDPLRNGIVENVAGLSPEGDLIVFSSFRGPHVPAWESGAIRSVDLSQQIAPHIRMFAPITSWQSPLSSRQYVAGMSTEGQLFVVGLTPSVDFINVTLLTGQRINSGLASWQTPDGPNMVEHLAGIAPGLGRGDLVVFYSSATPNAPAWRTANVVNVTAKTGQQVASTPIAWQTMNGSLTVEHLASSNSVGDLLEFYWLPGQDWRFANVSQVTGQKIRGSVTSWQSDRCGVNVEHLAGMSPNGDLLVFYRSPQRDWQVVNMSQIAGETIAGPATSWQTPDGPYNVEHIAAKAPNGDLLLFYTNGSEQLTAGD